MQLVDVNVLVGAMRTDSPRHGVMRAVLESLRASPEPFALCGPVLSGALRVLTHPRVFVPPTPTVDAVRLVQAVRSSPNAIVLSPGPRHWRLFVDLVAEAPARMTKGRPARADLPLVSCLRRTRRQLALRVGAAC